MHENVYFFRISWNDVSFDSCWQYKFQPEPLTNNKCMSCCNISFKAKLISSHTTGRCFMFFLHLSFYAFSLFSVGIQPPTLTDSIHTIQTVQTQISAAIFSSSFSTNIWVIYEACSNIYVISFPWSLLVRRIVEYINLCSHYGKLQVLIEKALTLPQLTEATRIKRQYRKTTNKWTVIFMRYSLSNWAYDIHLT